MLDRSNIGTWHIIIVSCDPVIVNATACSSKAFQSAAGPVHHSSWMLPKRYKWIHELSQDCANEKCKFLYVEDYDA